MLAFRPIAYLVGVFLIALGIAMWLPMLFDLVSGHKDAEAFLISSLITIVFGGGLTTLRTSEDWNRMSIHQTFLMTALVWLVLPIFGALPFMIGSTQLSFTEAFFEAMSGITTTGATTLEGLDTKSYGILLWRGLLQWMGGLGIVVVAIAILPELKVGGMQLFRSEAFDTFGKILPQAATIAAQLSLIYLCMTVAALMSYAACGMTAFDALVHSMTTVSTGGLANYDASLGHYDTASIHYVAAFFMLSSALPYVRLVQLANGAPRALYRDPQVRAFIKIVAVIVLVLTLEHWHTSPSLELSFRAVVFNVASIITGTGYAIEDYSQWGPFAMTVFLIIALIGGCAGSTSCSVKVFRYQVLLASVRAQIRMIQNPSAVALARYDGRPISDEIFSSVMAFFLLFFLTLAVLTLGFSLIGLDLLTSLSGAVAALGNIGPGLGPEIGPAGNYVAFPESAKWLFIIGMYLGRLELISVFVIFLPRFWIR